LQKRYIVLFLAFGLGFASRKADLPDTLRTEQIKSITRHSTNDMVAHYTKQANQKVLARAAIGKFEDGDKKMPV
jgi:hypothetical protein